MMIKVYLLLLGTCSVYGKVILDEQLLKDIMNNFINKEHGTKNSPEIYIDISSNKATFEYGKHSEGSKKTTISTVDEVPKIRKAQNRCDNMFSNEVVSNEIGSFVDYSKIDNGTALILTPFIENGTIEAARNACKVDSSIFLGVESYSGFLTVNKTYDSNLFFWYFPVEDKPANETPWIIWMQGGPGVTSLSGLFDEIGPFKVDLSCVISRNPYSWLQNHSLVFIDNPVGTGYSFTKHVDGLATDMPTYANHLHIAVQQLVQIFPELRMAPLYVAGESYAGKYVPALAMEIHKHKDVPGSHVNLQGVMIGNAFTDPSMALQITRSFKYFGLLTKEQLNIVEPLFTKFQRDVATNNSVEAKSSWGNLVFVLLHLSQQPQAYNFLKDNLTFGRFISFLKRSEVKRALHVGDIHFSVLNATVNLKIAPDFLSSSKHLFEQLLEHYRVLAYCGQLDLMMPCFACSEQYRSWKWSGASEFLEANRQLYTFDRKVAGYHKAGGRLTEVLVRGAGHMVPEDKPAVIQYLVTRWTHNEPVKTRRIDVPFIQEYVKNTSIVYL